MIVRLMKYMIGYIVFQAKGGFYERFINLCAMRRIDLLDVSLSGDTIKAKITPKNFRKLRGIARKTGVKISIADKRGLPFYMRDNRDRVGLLIGAGIFLFFMTVMNSFVWCIHSVDSEKISREQIIKAANDAGLHYGVKVSNFDEERSAREIYKTFDGELSWVKVNIKGSLAVIDFRDKVKKIEIEETGEPSNIIADFDGVIISDETYQGSKNKSRGDTVLKGDILISGVVEGVDMKPLYYQAKGKYSALHTVTSELTIAQTQNYYSFIGLQKRYHLIIFGVEIPLNFLSDSAENQREYTYKRCLQFEGYELPFGIKKTLVVKYNKRESSVRERELSAVLAYSEKTYNQFANTNILSYQIELKRINDSFNISGEYQCIDFIGENKKITIENS